MHMRHFLLAVFAGAQAALLALAPSGALAQRAIGDLQGFSSERLKVVTDFIKRDVEKGVIPGATLLIARDGNVVLLESIGMLDPAKRVPMRPDAIHRIASMTKPIVSVAAMRLVERGQLNLNDQVAQHLPELKGLQVLAQRDPAAKGSETVPARPITVHDLLRHTTGFTYWFVGQKTPIRQRYQDEDIDGLYGMDAAQMLQKLAKIPLLQQPGTTFEYGMGTDVLGHVIEKVTGKPLDRALAELVFEPLKMNDTVFHVGPDRLARMAQPAANDPDQWVFKWLRLTEPPKRFSGGAGAASTANDYYRFLQMLLNGGELDSVRLLSPQSVRYMLADHLGFIRGPNYLPGDGYGFGLGFAVRLADGLASVPGSAGDAFWGGITGPRFWIDPRERLAVVLLMQAPAQRGRYQTVMRNMIYGAMTREPLPDIATRPDAVRLDTLRPEVLRQLREGPGATSPEGQALPSGAQIPPSRPVISPQQLGVPVVPGVTPLPR
jgi:CubicO group peptidase (beta-lactamase class C family)